jgi:pullulanase
MTEGYKFKIKETEKLDNGCKYKIFLEVPMKDGWFEDVYFCIQKGRDLIPIKLKHKENKEGIVYFETEEDIFLETRAIYQYYFSYKCDGFRRFIKNEDIIGEDGIMLDEMFKMSVNFKAPDWAKGRMMYHIFVDRFYRGSEEEMKPMPRRHIHKNWDEPVVVCGDEYNIWNNDFFGGDLKGITKKLDYIESLGIDILYLSPIVYSQSTHRHDASDYEVVDPYAGTLDGLKKLCDEAQKRGMKVVLDAVFNHTGSDSKYFNRYQNKEWIEKENDRGAYHGGRKYSKFYKSHMGPDGCTYYHYWWGFDTLPVCNGDAKEWQEYITGKDGVIDQWFSCGIDGLRLDVADELTDY